MTVEPRDWTSGFFAGSLWLLHEQSRDEKWRRAAERYTARLESVKDYGGTHDLGFMLFCSYGNGLRLGGPAAYRAVLLNFDQLAQRPRVSPHGLDVDASGRTAITDIENHQVIVLDTYLNVDVAFGKFGSYDGQLAAPQGIAWTPRGDLLVADTGNARLQVFTDTGAPRRSFTTLAGTMRRSAKHM